jgi:hypothetical protein
MAVKIVCQADGCVRLNQLVAAAETAALYTPLVRKDKASLAGSPLGVLVEWSADGRAKSGHNLLFQWRG